MIALNISPLVIGDTYLESFWMGVIAMLSKEELAAIGIRGGWLTYSRAISIKTNKRTSTSVKYSVLPVNKTGKTPAYWDIDSYDQVNGNVAPAYFEVADISASKCEKGTISMSAQWYLSVGPRPNSSVLNEPSWNTSSSDGTGSNDARHDIIFGNGWLDVSGGFLSSAGLSIVIQLSDEDYKGEVSIRGNWLQSPMNRTKERKAVSRDAVHPSRYRAHSNSFERSVMFTKVHKNKIICLFALVAIMSSRCLSASEVDQFFLTNVLAAVVGYQTSRTLPSGITIPLFSTEPATGNGCEQGVLFYVIAPTNIAGRFFWMHHDGINAAGRSFGNYNPEGVYSFRYSNDVSDWGSITISNLISISGAEQSLCSLRPLGQQFFSSKSEVTSAVTRLDKVRCTVEGDIEQCKEKIKTLEVGSRPYNRSLGELKLLESQKTKTDDRRQKLLQKMSEVERNREFIESIKVLPSSTGRANHEK